MNAYNYSKYFEMIHWSPPYESGNTIKEKPLFLQIFDIVAFMEQK